MRLTVSVLSLGILVVGCGGTATSPPASASEPVNQLEMAGSAHNHSMPMPSAAPAESGATAARDSAGDTPTPTGSSVDDPSSAPTTTPESASASPASGANANLTVTIKSTPSSAVKNAVAYLEDVPKDKDVSGAMDNRQMAFTPHVVVVTAGSKVTFTNSDPFPHNVFSPDREKWDMGVIPPHATRIRRFAETGVYTALCNMHPNMKAYIVVVPSSYYAKADRNGEVVIRGVPQGKHKLVIWAPGVKTEQQEVSIEADKTVAVELRR